MSKSEACKFLATSDDFSKRLSAFDRSARLKTSRPVTEEEYLKFAGEHGLEWTDEEKDRIRQVAKESMERIESFSLPLPAKVLLIKSTGQEEGGAAYTRGAAIILPSSKVNSERGLAELFYHELFHVLSRNATELRERLYASIGFRKCGEVALPSDWEKRRLTNPDGPNNDHCIQVKSDGREVYVVPILLANTDTYDEKKGGEFFRYLKLTFVAIDFKEGSATSAPIKEGDKPLELMPNQFEGFFEQIGRNTQYIIHPDEILADNFVMLATNRRSRLPSPDVLEKIRQALTSSK